MPDCKYGVLKNPVYTGRSRRVCKRKPKTKRKIPSRSCKYGQLKRPVGRRFCKTRRGGRGGGGGGGGGLIATLFNWSRDDD